MKRFNRGEKGEDLLFLTLPGFPTRFCYSARVSDEKAAERSYAGLCTNCVHARQVQSDRGSVFVMCELALTDARFEKYPRLPVLMCAGYEWRDDPSAELTAKANSE